MIQQEKGPFVINKECISSLDLESKIVVGPVFYPDKDAVSDKEENDHNLSVAKNHRRMMKMFFS